MKGLIMLAKLLGQYMELPPENVVIYSQNWIMPNVLGIFLLLRINNVQSLGRKSISLEGGGKETATLRYSISVDMIGRPCPSDMEKDPRQRFFEMALSIYSNLGVSLMEQNEVSIQTLGDTIDLSDIEGAGVMCRFKQDFMIMEKVEKNSLNNYFTEIGDIDLKVQQ